MAQYGGNQHGDELRQTDQFGNPVHHHIGGEHGGHRGAEHCHGAPISMPHTTDAPLHRRSGSSSSSSSEDDGQGGRRKKGIKDKIKEKLPGGHKDDQGQHAPGYGGVQGQHAPGYGGFQGQPAAGYGGHQQPEKKGIMDKIKEKLPGGHHN